MGFFSRFKKPNWSEIASRLNATRLRGQRFVQDRIPQWDFKFDRRWFTRQHLAQTWATLMESRKKLDREWFKARMHQTRDFLSNSDQLLERGRKLLSENAYGTYARLGAAAFAAYFLADTVSLLTEAFIPEPPPIPAPRVVRKEEKRRSVEDYNAIITRNIFNSKGLIPDDNKDLAGGPARKTSLPFNLIGTVVLRDEIKSIATIEDKSQSMVFPVRINDTIADKAKITRIEHLKVYFINQSSGYLEYVEIVDEVPILKTEGPKSFGGAKSTGGGVTQRDDTHFEVERNAIDKATSNLQEVLQQARAIPNFENGQPDGYKLLQIVPGSLYDQIGLKNFDVICGVNGDPINDPGKAFQLFNELKTTPRLELCVKRNGRKMAINYDIR